MQGCSPNQASRKSSSLSGQWPGCTHQSPRRRAHACSSFDLSTEAQQGCQACQGAHHGQCSAQQGCKAGSAAQQDCQAAAACWSACRTSAACCSQGSIPITDSDYWCAAWAQAQQAATCNQQAPSACRRGCASCPELKLSTATAQGPAQVCHALSRGCTGTAASSLRSAQ